MTHYPILSAHEFIAQGTSAAGVAAIAAYLDDASNKKPNPDLAARVRRVAEEVAALTGSLLYGKRGHYTPAPKRMRADNSNRRVVARRAA